MSPLTSSSTVAPAGIQRRAAGAERQPVLRRSPRKAADPVNAILNYSYALGEAECTIALRAVGLDPGLGVLHADKRTRDSLALDLLEVLRPEIEARVLTLLATRHFRRADFHETPDGACRILAPLTHQLAEAMPHDARLVAPYAETAARVFADSHPGAVVPRTPLTKTKSRAGQRAASRRRSRTDTPPEHQPMPTCRVCGVELAERRRQLCPTCWPVTRNRLASERASKGVAARAARRAAGDPDPTTTAHAALKRSAALSSAKATETAWRRTNPDVVADPLVWTTTILPRLADVPLSRIQQATGLSVSACSKMRSGKLTPHVRHWAALAQIAAP
jgi:CRISPR associated protein Cas1